MRKIEQDMLNAVRAHASALYRHEILKDDRFEAAKEYQAWWSMVRSVEQQDGIFKVIALNPFR